MQVHNCNPFTKRKGKWRLKPSMMTLSQTAISYDIDKTTKKVSNLLSTTILSSTKLDSSYDQ